MKAKVIFIIPREDFEDVKVVIMRENFSTVRMWLPSAYYSITTKSVPTRLVETGYRYEQLKKFSNIPQVGKIEEIPIDVLKPSYGEVVYEVYTTKVVDVVVLGYKNDEPVCKITYEKLKQEFDRVLLSREEDEFINLSENIGWDTSDSVWEAANRRKISVKDFLKRAVESTFDVEVIDIIEL